MFLRGKVSYAQAQGPRKFQEDYAIHLPFVNSRGERGHLLGVMDGHSPFEDRDGGGVAKYCAETIPLLFDHNAVDADQELKKITTELVARTALSEMGSTLSLAYVNETQDFVTTCVLGDSPIIIVDKRGQVHQSVEHNVRTNLQERAIAIQRGAIYKDGYIQETPDGDGLQMSRVLGDRQLASIVDRTPALRNYHLGSRSVVIVASDGFFASRGEGADGDALESIVAAADRYATAVDLLRWREKQDVLEDNTSLIMWKAGSWWKWF